MRFSGRSLAFLLVILLLGAGAFYVDLAQVFHWPGINIVGYSNNLAVHEGLDLKGGIQFTMQAECPQQQPKCDRGQYMNAVIANVNRRISSGLGLNDAVVREMGGYRILIQLPGETNEQQARQLLGETGQMNIIDTGASQLANGTVVTPGQYKVVFTGAELNVNSISAGLDSSSGLPIVTFQFSGAAQGQFATYTQNNIGNFLTITLDNKVIESAQIKSQITGAGQISGLASVTDAQSLATILRYGALPLPLNLIGEQQLAATLGTQAIAYSIRAAIIGLGMVVLFMLIYYRLPGLLADCALVLYALFLFAVIKLLGVTLSLPGIAAVILTIGMAVDANILIFERLKEELRAGRTMSAAIDLGFKRAWPSIRDSNSSTLITCAILYWFGNNFGATLIVGFAINLAIGVLISLFTAVVVTRNFLHVLMVARIAQHPVLYGLSASALNLPRYRPSSRAARPAPAAPIPADIPTGTAAAYLDDAADELAPVGNGSNGGAPLAGSTHARGTSPRVEE